MLRKVYRKKNVKWCEIEKKKNDLSLPLSKLERIAKKSFISNAQRKITVGNNHVDKEGILELKYNTLWHRPKKI